MVHLPKPEDLQQKTKPKQTHSWTHSTQSKCNQHCVENRHLSEVQPNYLTKTKNRPTKYFRAMQSQQEQMNYECTLTWRGV